MYSLWLTAITTGMRKAEIFGLRWSACDLEAGIIRISQVARTVHQRGTILSEPKTEKSRRSIELPAVTVESLKAHREAHKQYEGFEGFTDQYLVFGTKRGTLSGSRNLLNYFHEAFREGGASQGSVSLS